MNNTGIDWTEQTWNPMTGCTKCSPGCKHCYAEALAKRLEKMGNPRYQDGFEVTLHRDKIDEPKKTREGRAVFVCSMGDLFHKKVPDDFIAEVFETMRSTPQHTYQVITKRADRWPEIEKLAGGIPRNVWCGVSVEDRRHMARLRPLSEIGDRETVRMVSIEPLLEDLGDPVDVAMALDSARLGWVISGGESGWKARPAEIEWFEHIRDACELAGIPYFHKQHGGRGTTHALKRGGDLATLGGELCHAYPQPKTSQRQAASSL